MYSYTNLVGTHSARRSQRRTGHRAPSLRRAHRRGLEGMRDKGGRDMRTLIRKTVAWLVELSAVVALTAGATQAAAAEWQLTNGPFFPWIASVSAHPDNPDEFLISGVSDRDYLTTDRGFTYEAVGDGGWGPYHPYHRHPKDPMFLMMNNRYSEDGGRTWTVPGDGSYQLAMAPGNPDLVYGWGYRWENDEGWFDVGVSTDRGRTFEPRGAFGHTVRQNTWVQRVAVDAVDSDVLLVLISEDAGDQSVRRLHRSTDGGMTWELLPGPDEQVIDDLAGDPNQGGVVLAITPLGLYRSGDGGASWDRILDTAGDSPGSTGIVFDPSGSGKIWLSTHSQIRVSTNQGVTWDSISYPWPNPTFGPMISPVFGHPSQLYISDGTRVFFTEDGGKLWDPVSIPEIRAQVSSIAVDPVDSRRVYAGGCCGSRTFGSTDGGDSWTKLSDESVEGIFIHPQDPARIYFLGWGLKESLDYGDTWRELGDFREQTRTQGNKHISCFSFNPDDSRTIYIGAGGYNFFDSSDPDSWGHVFVSEDGGAMWSRVPFFEPNQAILGVAARPGDPNTLVVATSNRGIFRTTDGGASWDHMFTDYARGSMGRHNLSSRMQVDPENPDVIVVAPQVLVSEDFGATWEVRSPDPNLWLSGPVLVTHPFEGVTRLVLPEDTTEGAVYVSDDLGRSWTRVLTGIEDQLNVLAPAGDGTFYATTNRSGVVKGRLDILAITSVSPSGGQVAAGATITVRGMLFGAMQGTGSVKLNWFNAPIVSWSETAIICTMPVVKGEEIALILTTDARERIILENVFVASAALVKVLSPNGGEQWPMDTVQEIRWEGDSSISEMKIEYSTNNGVNWNVIVASTPNDGAYSWSVPDQLSSQYLVRISAVSNIGLFDTSNDVFAVLPRVIAFTDPNLEAAVRESIGKPSGDILTGDVLGMRKLDASGKSITNLDGMENLVGLRDLSIHHNRISDLSPLSGLTNLQTLDLIDNQISDLSPLGGLTNLEFLDLSVNQISDVSPLSNMTDLLWLFFGVNQISDLSPLSGLTSLQVLHLGNNEISDPRPLANLTDLRVLYLDDNQIQDIAPLAGLTKIGQEGEWVEERDGVQVHLDLSSNQISEISPLVDNPGIGAGDGLDLRGNPLNNEAYESYIPTLEARGVNVLWLTTEEVNIPDPSLEAAIREALNKPEGPITKEELAGLADLQASERGIGDLSGIEHCVNLQTLDLISNQISDLSPLGGLTNLANLTLETNQISDLSPLSSLTNLQTLYMYNNQFSDLSPLSNLTNLRLLNLDSNQISDISPLSGLTNLENLVLNFTQISDLSSLSGLTRIQILELQRNQISDISPLVNLTDLRSLYLDGNQIQDISPLAGLRMIGEKASWFFEQEGVRIHLGLSNNRISDLSPLVSNDGIGEGDGIDLRGNPLNAEAFSTQIPALQARGVEVLFDELAPRIKEAYMNFFHSGDKEGEGYSLLAWIEVDDPQGLNTITKVELRTPDDLVYALEDDGTHCDGEPSDGRYGLCSGNADSSPLTPGDYTITVIDEDGYETAYIQRLSGVLDLPEISSPREGKIVTSPPPVFRWNSVEGATEYAVDVWDMQGSHLWDRRGVTKEFVIYNDDDGGGELMSGETYRWRITAFGDNIGVSFWEAEFSYVLPEGPISIDFNLTEGDQEKRKSGNASLGQTYELQLNVAEAPESNGWSVNIEYDPTQVGYVSDSFQASDFIPGMLALVDEKDDMVGVGGTVLGTDASNSGDGTLGTLSFEVLEGFTESTDLVITRVTFRRLDGVEDKRTVHSVATITSESILPGDFDGDGDVDFDDFFLFADRFGTVRGDEDYDGLYDLNSSGIVDFDDFFIFADNFGKEARAKLIALAHEYLGLPLTPGLEPNYPNPFNSSTTIRYHIVESAQVQLDIFDLTGQRVKSLVNETHVPGSYEIMWDGTNEGRVSVSSGLYFTKLEVGEFTEVRKMMLMK